MHAWPRISFESVPTHAAATEDGRTPLARGLRKKSTPLMRVCGRERHEPCVRFGDVTSAQAELLLGQHHD